MRFSAKFLKNRLKLMKYTSVTALISTSAGWIMFRNNRKQPTKVSNNSNPSIIDQAWDSIKFSYAKHLITLAKSSNMFVANRAISMLCEIHDLNRWHFAMISRMLDARTALALARCAGVNSQFFVEPPKRLVITEDVLRNSMQDLLGDLNRMCEHRCLDYFVSKVFSDHSDSVMDEDSQYTELSKYIRSHQLGDFLQMCLETLLHHASTEKYAKDIIELNGLPLLMELYFRFKDTVEIVALICKIMSLLSQNRTILHDLHGSGWIYILSEWMRHEDIRVSIPAAKILANLDSSDFSVYKQRLYPIHPTVRTVEKPKVDVIFVHGLLGGVFYTWRQRARNEEILGLIGKRRSRRRSVKDTISRSDYPSDKTKRNSRKKARTSDPDTREFIENLKTDKNGGVCSSCPPFEFVCEDIPVNLTQSFDHSCCTSSECEYLEDDTDESYTPCWPKDWLPEDCDNLRIIGVNYDTNLSLWMPACPNEHTRNLEERSDELMAELRGAGVGQRPIVWVTHSMGGLMVKNMLCKAFESSETDIRNISLNTKGVVFFSTPHLGSSVADLNQASSFLLWPTIEVKELKTDSQYLKEIQRKFMNLNKKLAFKVISFVETNDTVLTAMKFRFKIVTPESGNLGIGEYYEIPLNHLGICKPASKHSFLYKKVLNLIKETL